MVHLGGHAFAQTVTEPNGGNSLADQIAVDHAAGLLFTSNPYQGVVSVSIATGETVAAQSFTTVNSPGGNYAEGVAVDPSTHRVFASAYNYTPGGSTVVVLNESDLSLDQRVGFPGVRGQTFLPRFETFDPVTHRLFVQNTTPTSIAVFAGDPLAFVAYITLPAGLPSLHAASSMDTPYPQLLVPAGNATLYEVNETSLVVQPFPTLTTYPDQSLVAAAYDSHNQLVWAENYSAGTMGILWTFNATTTAFAGGWIGGGMPWYGNSLAYNPAMEALVFTNATVAHGLGALNVTSGSAPFFETAYAAAGGSYAFDEVISDPVANAVFAASGGPERTAISEFSVSPISLVRNYTSFPLFSGALAIDPSNGFAYAGGYDPSVVTAFHESDGSVAWTIAAPLVDGFFHSVAVDPTVGTLFAAGAGQLNVTEFNATTGAWVHSIPMAGRGPVDQLAVDPVHHYLYVQNSSQVYVFSTRTYALLANVSVGALDPQPNLLTDPTRDRAWVFDYGGGPRCGNLTEIDPLNGTATVAVGLVTCPEGIAVDASGDLWVDDGTNTSVVDPSTGRYVANVSSPALAPWGVGYDGRANLIVVGSINSSYIGFINASTHTFVGSLYVPTPTLVFSYDGSDGTLAMATDTSAQLILLREVFAPSAPQAVTLVAGNGTLAASWSAPANLGGGPVTGYNVSLGASANGPWTRSATVSTLSYTFGGLALGTVYYVIVTAINAAGVSAASSPVSGTPVSVPYPPTGVALTAISSSSLGVRWTSPSISGGTPVVNYTVEYATTAAGPWTDLSAGADLNATVKGLAASTTYVVRVVAWNAVGASAPSATSSAGTNHGGSGGAGSLSSLDWAIIAVVLLVAIGGIGAVVLMRRRKGGTAAYSPPPAMDGSSMPSSTSGPVPPGAPGAPPNGPPPGAM